MSDYWYINRFTQQLVKLKAFLSTMFSTATVFFIAAALYTNSVSAHSGSCLPPPSLKFIESALANISNQLASVTDPSLMTSVGESLSGVTNLLHVSLLREVLTDYKQSSDNDEGLTLLRRIERVLNESSQIQVPSEIK